MDFPHRGVDMVVWMKVNGEALRLILISLHHVIRGPQEFAVRNLPFIITLLGILDNGLDTHHTRRK